LIDHAKLDVDVVGLGTKELIRQFGTAFLKAIFIKSSLRLDMYLKITTNLNIELTEIVKDFTQTEILIKDITNSTKNR